jgi:hypothetical protein
MRVTAQVEINEGRLDAEAGPILRRKHASITRQINTQAKANVPVRTGALGRSGEELPQTYRPFRVSGGVKFGGGAEDVDYAAAVHEGTRAHVIRARGASALHFFMGSREVFAKSVFHPGTKARPFLRNAGMQVVASDPDIH